MRMHSQKVSGKKAWSKLRRQEAIAFYLFILPWVIGFFLFYLGPMLGSLYFSFTKWDLLTPPELVGLANYVRIFTRDPLFLQSLKVTVIYTLAYIPLDMAFGLLIAVLMNRKIRGIGALRTIYYMPSVLSGVAYVVMWMWMFHPQNGLINNALFGLGIEGPRWLLDPQWALSALVIMSLWGVGRSMVIYLAGLQDISPELYEAASIDGANIWQKFRRITLPLLTPSILFNLIFGFILTFQSFTNSFVATNGGPLDSTLFYVLYLYRKAFEHLQMGYASALAWILFIIVLIFTLLIFASSRRWVYYRSVGE
jgi:multiple sugar transport system permease protein